jgi:ubiquinone/menaquinone biosynthesis C-methylase UbiE
VPTPAENKFDNAIAYELFVGRWSCKIAKEFIRWLAVPAERAWLDVGAGTGIVSDAILQQANPAKVVGIDTTQAFVTLDQERIKDPRAQFHVGDAQSLDFIDLDFDVSVAGLVLNFIPSAQQAVNNMVRLVKQDGLVAAYV